MLQEDHWPDLVSPALPATRYPVYHEQVAISRGHRVGLHWVARLSHHGVGGLGVGPSTRPQGGHTGQQGQQETPGGGGHLGGLQVRSLSLLVGSSLSDAGAQTAARCYLFKLWQHRTKLGCAVLYFSWWQGFS